MKFWVILVGFRQGKNGQTWKDTVNSDILNGFWMPEHWKHCKNHCFGPTLCRKTCKLRCFWLKTLLKPLKKQCFWRIFCMYGWVGQHGKIEGDKGLGNIVKNEFWNGFYGDTCVNYRVLKENVAKTCKHTSKNTGFGWFCGKKAVLALAACLLLLWHHALSWNRLLPSLSNFPPLTYKDWLACQQTRSSCSTPPLAPVTDQKEPAVWAATPREAGWIPCINGW